MLAEALAADVGRDGGGGGPADIFAGMGVEFKEVGRTPEAPPSLWLILIAGSSACSRVLLELRIRYSKFNLLHSVQYLAFHLEAPGAHPTPAPELPVFASTCQSFAGQRSKALLKA